MKLQPITRANRPPRKEVLMGEEQAAEPHQGWRRRHRRRIRHCEPSDDDHARLIRRKVKNLTVIGAATAGLEIDLLIGAGCVRKVIAPYIGAELHAPVGTFPLWRAENDEIEVYETTEYLLYSQLDAAARGWVSAMARRGRHLDPGLNNDYVPFNDPINGEPYLAVPALHADWAIIHVGQADAYGNGQHGGARFGDRLLSRAAERVMLTAERIVPNSEIRKNPFNIGRLC